MTHVLLERGVMVFRKVHGPNFDANYIFLDSGQIKEVGDINNVEPGTVVFQKAVEFINDNVIVYERYPAWVKSLSNVSRKSRLYTTLASAGILHGVKKVNFEELTLTESDAIQIIARFYDEDED